MNIRKVAFAAVSLAVLVPAISNASPEKMSLKACADAFAASLASASGNAPSYKLAYRDSVSGAMTDFYPSEFTFTLEAKDPKTGSLIARAVCSANSRGAVETLAALPLDQKSTVTTLAAR